MTNSKSCDTIIIEKRKGNKKMFDYLFIDNESGEEFFVESSSLGEAWEIAIENFGEDADLAFIDEYTVEEAEILGYDTY